MVLARVTRHTADVAYRPAVYIRSDCPGSSPSPDLACDTFIDPSDVGSGEPHDGWDNTGWADALADALPRGVYYVVVDGAAGTHGGFTLDVTVGPPRHGEDCSDPIPLQLDENGVASYEGDLSFGRDDFDVKGDSYCFGGDGADLVFSFELSTPATLEYALTAHEEMPAVLVLRSVCGDLASEMPKSCVDSASRLKPGEMISTLVPRVEAGTYYLIVDGKSHYLQGAFRLDFKATSLFIPNDACPGEELQFDEQRVAKVSADTTVAANDYSPACGVFIQDGPDLVYNFELRTPAVVQAKVLTDSGTNSGLVIRASCESTSGIDYVGCARGTSGQALFTTPLLPPGRYFVFVENDFGGMGPFTLEVTLIDPPANGICDGAKELVFDAAGEIEETGNTAGSSDTFLGSCAPSSANDLVYSFTLTAMKDVQVWTQPMDSTYRSYVYVRTDCEDPASEVGCVYSKTASGAPVIQLNGLAPGTYFVIVDGAVQGTVSTFSGPFKLFIKAHEPASRPANDTCANPELLTFNGGTTGIMEVDTTGAVDDLRGTCEVTDNPMVYGSDGPDRVYLLRLANPAGVSVTLTRQATTYRHAVYLRRTCDSAAPEDELACLLANNEGTAYNTLSFERALSAGDYYLIVDGYMHRFGKANLEVRLTDWVVGNSCDDVALLSPFDEQGKSLTVGDTSKAVTAATPSCTTYESSDLVYALQVGVPTSVRITAKAAAGSNYRPVLSVRSQCSVPESELGCQYVNAAGGVAELRLVNLDPGTYYIWVDSYTSSSTRYNGPFELLVEKLNVNAPENDVCGRAKVLPAFGPPDENGVRTTSIEGDTSDASDRYRVDGKCLSATTLLDGGDLVYLLNLDEPSVVTATVERTGANNTLRPGVYIRRECEDPSRGAMYTCKLNNSTGTGAGTVTTEPTALPKGISHIIVDGASGTRGAFKLTVSAKAGVAPGDACFNAREVPIGVDGTGSVTGDTAGGTHSGEGSCYGFGSATYPDHVYTFTIPEERNVRVRLHPDPDGMNPNLFIRPVCGEPLPELFCEYGLANIDVISELVRLPAGTYYAWVKAVTTGGTYTVEVDTRPYRENDTCAHPEALVFEGNTATVFGNTRAARDTYQGSCVDTSGPDLVYQFQTDSPRGVSLEVKRDSADGTFEPVVYLRRQCEVASALEEPTCAANRAGSALGVVETLPPGTWHVVVDGARGSMGAFRLTATLRPPASGLPNESCFGAEPLVLNDGRGTAISSTRLARTETKGSCSHRDAHDLVYRIEVPGERSITATVSPFDSDYRPAVFIRRECGSRAEVDELACAAAPAPGSPARAEVARASQGVYYVWVSGKQAWTGGAFSLLVELGEPK